jgi:hypothetical protein
VVLGGGGDRWDPPLGAADRTFLKAAHTPWDFPEQETQKKKWHADEIRIHGPWDFLKRETQRNGTRPQARVGMEMCTGFEKNKAAKKMCRNVARSEGNAEIWAKCGFS